MGYLGDAGGQAHQQAQAHFSVNGKEGGKPGHHQTSLPILARGDQLILWENPVPGALPVPFLLPWERCCSYIIAGSEDSRGSSKAAQ